MTQQFDRQLSLTVSDPKSQFSTIGQSSQQTSSGSTTNFSDDSATVIEFGKLTKGNSAVKAGTRPTAGFSIVFDVRRGDIQTPNSADVRIYNVSPETANSISTREFRRLEIQAGYPGNFGLIFRGEIKQVRLGRESAVNTYIDITAADGDSAYNYSAMALTLAKGYTPKNAIQAFIQSMAAKGSVTQGYTPELTQSGSVRGRVFYGMTRDELRDFAAAQGLYWSIQDGSIVFIPKQGYIPGTPVVISPQTGLIEVPEQTQNGIECRVLLNPQIKIGQLVSLQNTTINQLRYGLDIGSQGNNNQLSKSVKTNPYGLYYCMSADHSGETRGTRWESKLTLLSVDAQVPVSQISRAAIQPSASAIRLN